MTTDAPGLREAAEHILSVIEAHDIATFDCDRRGDVYCDCLDKAKSRLRASLATHPSDGGEAISEAKCRAMGAKDGYKCLQFEAAGCFSVDVGFYQGVAAVHLNANDEYSALLSDIRTMDDLRHLLAALGCGGQQTTKGTKNVD